MFQTQRGTTIRSAPVRAAVTAALAKAAAAAGGGERGQPVRATRGRADQPVRHGRVRPGDLGPASCPDHRERRQETDQRGRRPQTAADVRVSLGGPAITNSERAGLGRSLGVGIVAALTILLIVFGGALLPSLLPLLTTLLALGIGVSLIGLLSHAFTISSVSTQLAVLIGLGVGVDYGLFVIGRYRSAVKSGTSNRGRGRPGRGTSGRTVLLAGSTVCVALLGQFALGVSFLYGPSVAAALAVALTMATSLTLLPAMLGFLGQRVLSRRERRALAANGPASAAPAGFWLRWARFVEAHRVVVALGALAAVVALALPIFGLSLGTSDSSTDPASWTTHQSYAALAQGFGPGFNGPLELAAQTGSPAGAAAFGTSWPQWRTRPG